MDRLLWVLSIVLVTGALGFACTYVTRSIARKAGFVAKPRAERWHKRPTALAGGIGIFAAFAPALVYFEAWPLLLGGAAMFVLGLVDDIFQLKPYAKLAGQLLIAAITVTLGPTLPWTPFPILNQALSLFWIVGITNAINLLDNMDGLAAGVATIAVLFQCVFSLLQGQYALAGISAALAGALLGFLVFNWNPASIFMGDCGALFLGYSLAVLGLEQSYGRSRSILVVIAAPVMVMLVPIFDTAFVTLTRILRGRPVSQGGRDHTSHRLVRLGLSERVAVIALLSVGALGGVVALSARVGFQFGIWIGAPLLVITLAFVAIHLARTDSPELGASVGLLGRLRTFGYKRRLFEVLLDLVLAMVSLIAAFLLRFDGDIPASTSRDLARVFPVIIVAKVLLLYVTRAYDGVWRYVGLRDIARLIRGALYGTIAAFIICIVWFRLGSLSRGALFMDAVIYGSLLATSRIAFRVLGSLLPMNASEKPVTRALVWGAGDAGAALVRKLLDAPEEGLIPVGFVDDDPAKRGRKIHGVRVLGRSDEIATFLQGGLADRVLLASQSINQDRILAVAVSVGKERLARMRFVLEELPRFPSAMSDA